MRHTNRINKASTPSTAAISSALSILSTVSIMRITEDPDLFVSWMMVEVGVGRNPKRGNWPVIDLHPMGGYLQILTAAWASSAAQSAAADGVNGQEIKISHLYYEYEER